jgi:hypothetical protein
MITPRTGSGVTTITGGRGESSPHAARTPRSAPAMIGRTELPRTLLIRSSPPAILGPARDVRNATLSGRMVPFDRETPPP